jgi:arsenate reductase
MENKPKILFLSRGNASRGLMAQGFLRDLAGDQFISKCAGTDGDGVSPLVMEVMNEVGIDISTQEADQVASLFRQTFHCVVALCEEPRERYPLYPFTRKLLRWSVPNPDGATGGPEDTKQVFREVRDQLRTRVEELIETMQPQGTALAAARAAAS